MRTGRPKSYQVEFDARARAQLERYARSRSLPHAMARRAKIILLAADGITNSAIAEQLGVSNPTIAEWCKRFIADGLAGFFGLAGATWSARIRIVNVRPVGNAVGRDGEHALGATSPDLIVGVRDHARTRRTRLHDGWATDLRRAELAGQPRQTVEAVALRDSHAEHAVVEDFRR